MNENYTLTDSTAVSIQDGVSGSTAEETEFGSGACWDHSYLIFLSTEPTRIAFFHTNNAASKSIILSHIFVWKIEKLLNPIFQRMFIFRFLLALFFLFNNTLHVIFYTYICYWSRFQYKYITFHVVKQSHAGVTSKDICLFFIILFLCLFLFFLNFILFHEALLFLRCLIDLVYSYILKFYRG